MTKITIRHSEPEDIQAIKEIYECVSAYSDTLQLPYPSVSSWESRIGSIPDNSYSYVAEVDDKIVGNLGFELCKNPRRRHAGSFGMGVRDEYQGKGVGKALLSALIELTDKWLNVKRIEMSVYTVNEPAIALYKKFGFIIEGESKDYAFRNGEFVDVYHMARFNRGE